MRGIVSIFNAIHDSDDQFGITLNELKAYILAQRLKRAKYIHKSSDLLKKVMIVSFTMIVGFGAMRAFKWLKR